MGKTFREIEQEAFDEGQKWIQKRIEEKLKEEATRQEGEVSPLRKRRKRRIKIQTVAGQIELETIYGFDALRNQWIDPFKEKLGLKKNQTISPLLAERLCFTATQSLSYQSCAEISMMWGIDADDSKIHRIVQDYGSRFSDQREEETERILDPTTRLAALAELENPDCDASAIVIMMDGWMIRERGEQWGFKPVDAPANRVDWREMKTGIVFHLKDRALTQTGRHILIDKYYEAFRGDPYEFGRRLFSLALRQGLRKAKNVYVIADGAVWIWNLVSDRFSQATQVLDIYHAYQHLHAIAQHLFPDDSERAEQWWKLRKQRLKQMGTIQVDRILKELNQRVKTLNENSATAVKTQIAYLEKNRERMDYPKIEQEKAPIASGAIESTCSQMQDRFKRTGQFWTQTGCQNLAVLEIIRKNKDWDRYWEAA